MVGREQLTGTLPSKVLDFIDVLTAPVIPSTGIPFRILIRQDRAQSFQNSLGDEIFAGNEFQSPVLAMSLGLNESPNRRIDFLERRH
jgi:hypothetical protein